MWDTLAIIYEGTSQVNVGYSSHTKYKLFTKEKGKDIQSMFRHFQTILNALRSLGRTYDNYDHIYKILRRLSRKQRSKVTTLRDLKNLDSMSLEELIGTQKVHKQELQQDEGLKKGKSFALHVQKTTKESSSRPSYKGMSKALSVDNPSNEDDKLAFISRKIGKMLQTKVGTKWKNSSKKVFKEKGDKDKSFIIGYGCKKLEHFKSECPNLGKPKDKNKQYKSKGKKGLMSTCEILDGTLSDEEGEGEANLCLMANTTSKESELDQEEIDFDNPELLKQAYHELLSNTSILSKAFENMQKGFKKLSKDHKELE